MDLEKLLTDLLLKTDATALAWLAVTATGTKFGVDLVKKIFLALTKKELAGNPAQTATGLVALAATLVQAASVGAFAGGVSQKEGLTILLVWALTGLGATGFNEWLANRGGGIFKLPPPPPPAPSADELQGRIDRVRGGG